MKTMGIQQSTRVKQKENNLLSMDIKNVTAKTAVAKKVTDFNHGEANDLIGNRDNVTSTSEGQGPAQLISHQMEHRHPADAPQNREQSIHEAANTPQDADQVNCIPLLVSTVRGTPQHTSPAKPKDEKTSTPKPMLQQATPARPTAGPCDGVKITAEKCDALSSDILQHPQVVPEKLSQQRSRHTAPVQQRTKPVQPKKKNIAPAQQQANRRSHTQHEGSRNFTLSRQKPAAKETKEVPLQSVRTVAPCDMVRRATADTVHNSEASASVRGAAQVPRKDGPLWLKCSFGSKEQQEMTPPPQLPTSKPVRRTYAEVVRGVTTEKQHSKEAAAQMKAKIDKPPNRQANCVLPYVNEAGTDSTRHAADGAHNIAGQSSTAKPGVAEVPPADSHESAPQANKDVNALHEHCLKLAKTPGDDPKSSQKTDDQTVTSLQERSQLQGCVAVERITIEERNEQHQILQPNKASNVTNRNTSSCIQVNVKALTPQVPVADGMPTAAPNKAATHNPTTAAADTSVNLRLQLEPEVSLPQDTAVKPKKKCTHRALTRDVTMKEEMNGNNRKVEREKQEPDITPAVPPEHKVHTEGRWHPFTVNRSCSRKLRCQHNPGKGLPPNIQKWCDGRPAYLCEPAWVTAARFAACLALREPQEEGGRSHQ